MAITAERVVQTARTYIGCREADGSHRKIIDIYNSQTPLPRGYTLGYADPWCAAFVSAVAVELRCTDILPTECSCGKLIAKLQALGIWVENDAHTPAPGDLVFYDWDDSGTGDCRGGSDHVGIVEAVSGSTVTVIEGNYGDAVKRRTLTVGGRYIRGYGVPHYDSEEECTVQLQILKKGIKNETVRAMQRLLIAGGFSCGKWADDGSFGGATEKAVRAYRKAKGLGDGTTCDGAMWRALLGVG